MNLFNIAETDSARCQQLVTSAISILGLKLDGLTILTEAASGYYALTPLIAAAAGAEKVYALAHDSRFGSAAAVAQLMGSLSERWSLAHAIEPIFSKQDERVRRADIVTNLGFLRPLSGQFLASLSPSVVVPLMFETWEFRASDIDLTECRRLGIPVLGTDEHHPELRIFEYIGHLALKLLYEARIEVFGCEVIVFGSGEFAEQVVTTLRAVHTKVSHLQSRGELSSDVFKTSFQRSSALIVVEHHDRRELIGRNGAIAPEELHKLNPSCAIVHICGSVERESLTRTGLHCVPQVFAPAGYMSVATDYLGPRPLVFLHTAGLKVGEAMAQARRDGLTGAQAEAWTLKNCALAQSF